MSHYCQIHLLSKNMDKINWNYLSGNRNAIRLLEANPNKAYGYNISSNPNAIQFLESYPLL